MKFFLNFFLYFLWPLFYPFLHFICVPLVKFCKKRNTFERKNLSDQGAQSFREVGETANTAFEVSSVGELEIVLPLIENLLEREKKVELIYCSPSVETQCQDLYAKYPQNIRILRLPLISYFPFTSLKIGQNLSSWMTAQTLVLCRYDFFPELLKIGMEEKIKFVLVSATSKNKKTFLKKALMEKIYSLFNPIVTSTKQDQKFLQKILKDQKKEITSCEFRIQRIATRLAVKKNNEKLNELMSFLGEYYDQFQHGQKIVLGSYWPEESQILNNKNLLTEIKSGKKQLTIVPHMLSTEAENDILADLEKITGGKIPLYVYRSNLSVQEKQDLAIKMQKENGILVVMVSGILCELYTHFKHAYVGGGFKISIHSVLEPYLAGCVVYCGPRVHRSTEYECIKEKSPELVHLLKNEYAFYDVLKSSSTKEVDYKVREELVTIGDQFLGDFCKTLG